MSRIALLVIGLTVLAVALRAGDCSGWQVEELLRAPDWYVRAVEDAHSINATQVEDSLWRTDYVLDLTKSFIYYRHDWQVDSL